VALPLVYNVESIRQRWKTTIVAVLGIAGSVGVFLAMAALEHGFRAALVSSGSPDNVLVRRMGATNELDSVVTLDQANALEDVPEIARSPEGVLVSRETVVIANLPLKESGADANVQVRGVTPRAFLVHRGIRIVDGGRMMTPGTYEMMVGKNASASYAGATLGSVIRLGGASWTVVGIMDSGGSSFDSEIWCDHTLLAPAYHRPIEIFSSVAARLSSPEALSSLRDRTTTDPRLQVELERETDYYERASERFTTLIKRLGIPVGGIMALGAIFAALNTMYSAVAERAREIATIRAIGFGGTAVVVAFLIEALLIAFVGGVIGGLCALPLNGLTTGTMNWQTFSHLSFAFQITPVLLVAGILFALLMGIAGGLPPALRAARLPITTALRDL
jgi:putative ABC transport system permease protein